MSSDKNLQREILSQRPLNIFPIFSESYFSIKKRVLDPVYTRHAICYVLWKASVSYKWETKPNFSAYHTELKGTKVIKVYHTPIENEEKLRSVLLTLYMERGYAIRDRWLCESRKTKLMVKYNLLNKTNIMFTAGKQTYDLDKLKKKIASVFQQTERRLNREIAMLLVTDTACLLVDNLRTLGISKGECLHQTLLRQYGGSILCEDILLPDKIEMVEEIIRNHKNSPLTLEKTKRSDFQ